MTRRDALGRHKYYFMALAWSFSPLLVLATYIWFQKTGNGFATALFSESQSRIFRWLLGQPDRAFHLTRPSRCLIKNAANAIEIVDRAQ